MNTYVKPKVLVIALEYYPVQNANTSIIRKLVSQLGDKYDFTIATQNTGNEVKKENIFGIQVVRTTFHAFSKKERTNNNSILDIVKMLYFKGLSKYKGDDVKQKDIYFFIQDICNIINIKEYDLILSFSNPFLSHCCASVLSGKYTVPWIAYYLDPFFSNATLDKRRILKRKATEEEVLRNASRILLTYPINENYLKAGVNFHEKVVMTEMPGITFSMYVKDNLTSLHRKVKCYFVGNLYKDIRTPDVAIKAFKLLAADLELYFVGSLDQTFSDMLKASSGNIFSLGRMNPDEILQIYKDADILVNIGNSIDNQMPSKIFEYISTGKPILNFYKTANCPTLKYLTSYPLALNIFEEELLNDFDNNIKRIKEFCFHKKGKTVPVSWIQENFKSNTDETVAWFLGEQISSVLLKDEQKADRVY